MQKSGFFLSCIRHKVLTGLISCLFALGVGLWCIKQYKLKFYRTHSLPLISLDQIDNKDNLVPFLVLGSGPASLSAALYGARAKIRTVVLKGNQPGGQLTSTTYVENWPGIRKIRGPEVMQDLEQQALRFGAIMVSDAVKSVDFSQWPYVVITEEGKKLHAMSIFIGTGSTPRRLGVPGEAQYFGKGVTTCAICDAPFNKGYDVVVVGGGDSAVEEAMELAPYAKNVKVLVRTDKMRASPSMIEQMRRCDNVTVDFNMEVVEIKGANEHVKGIVVKNRVTKEIEHWDNIKGVFLAIGHDPNTKIFNNQIATTSHNYIKLDSRRQHTSVEGVFAAGDVADDRYKQAGVASGDGVKAGLDAVWWLGHLGYNSSVESKLEHCFFDPHFDARVEVKQVNSVDELDGIIEEHKEKIIILDFYTQFCPSCMHMMPVIEWVGTKMADKVLFLKINASIAFDLVKKYKAEQVPCFVVLKAGKIVETSFEVMDRAQMFQFAKKHVTH